MGGNRPQSPVKEREWLLGWLAAVPDLTLRALVVELGERGVVTTTARFGVSVHGAGSASKKSRPMPTAGL
jgi:hypothetical protein